MKFEERSRLAKGAATGDWASRQQLTSGEVGMTQKRLRVLLAEGAPSGAGETLRTLYAETEHGLDLTIVSSITTLLPTIKVVDPEVILLDLALNLLAPLDAVHLVHRTAPGVPLIVIADPAEKEEAKRSLKEGALDYMLKGFMDAQTVERVIRTAMERNTLTGLTDLMRDPVTELYTRDGFLTVGRRHAEAMRSGGSLVLICALIDNLQTLREAFGPGAADHALSDMASLMKGSCRRSDVVGRLGEAQFAMLGVDAAGPSGEVMRNRLEQHLTVYNQTRSAWGPIELRSSVGAWCAKDGRSFEHFLDAVESRLRVAASQMQTEEVQQTHPGGF
jgi:diguanylate cyclase (GGDEF)-like protein